MLKFCLQSKGKIPPSSLLSKGENSVSPRKEQAARNRSTPDVLDPDTAKDRGGEGTTEDHQKKFKVESREEALCVLGKTGRTGLQIVRYF